jgi:hypothetical protein
VTREQALPPRRDRDGAERVVAAGGGRRRSGGGGGRNELQLEGDGGVRGEVAVSDREGQERASSGEADPRVVPVLSGVDGLGLGSGAELLPRTFSFSSSFFAAAVAEKAGERRPHADGCGAETIPVPSSQAPRERGAPPGREAVDAEVDL